MPTPKKPAKAATKPAQPAKPAPKKARVIDTARSYASTRSSPKDPHDPKFEGIVYYVGEDKPEFVRPKGEPPIKDEQVAPLNAREKEHHTRKAVDEMIAGMEDLAVLAEEERKAAPPKPRPKLEAAKKAGVPLDDATTVLPLAKPAQPAKPKVTLVPTGATTPGFTHIAVVQPNKPVAAKPAPTPVPAKQASGTTDPTARAIEILSDGKARTNVEITAIAGRDLYKWLKDLVAAGKAKTTLKPGTSTKLYQKA